HLGFIIDAVGASPAVAADGGHVDLYGYTSMAVGAIQAQQRRIDALTREVAALRAELARLRRRRRTVSERVAGRYLARASRSAWERPAASSSASRPANGQLPHRLRAVLVPF